MSKETVTIEEPGFARILFASPAASWIWLVARLYLGYNWLHAGLEKVTGTESGWHWAFTSTSWLKTSAGLKGFAGFALSNAKGPHAADLLYQRMAALGLSRSDVDRIGHGLMRDLEKTCACCNDKSQCKKDLAARSGDAAWKDYCPNAVSLESVGKTKAAFHCERRSSARRAPRLSFSSHSSSIG